MGKYGDITEDFYTERTRILHALGDEPHKHVVMRLIGALAFRTHCPEYGYIQDKLGREFTDFDFASYPRYTREITRVLTELGYSEDKQVTQLFGDRRMLFHDPVFERHIDVFYNVLDFCHPINFVGRLEIEEFTLPLAELLLEKMQIVQINEKDLIETINAKRITSILGNDWGFWRTVTANLVVLNERLDNYENLSAEDRKVVRERIVDLEGRIEAQPKTLRWKARAKIGEKMKWYKSVEELER
jgi:hypothetical protein